ncbi:MAG: hypothetical protein AABX19_00595 [Nanoarchaeota archaeon]
MKNSVRVLKSGGNDDSGSFFQSLEIVVDGEKHFVLHQGAPKDSENYMYRKAEFKTEEELLKANSGYAVKSWEDTNNTCGYDLPYDLFLLALRVHRTSV